MYYLVEIRNGVRGVLYGVLAPSEQSARIRARGRFFREGWVDGSDIVVSVLEQADAVQEGDDVVTKLNDYPVDGSSSQVIKR